MDDPETTSMIEYYLDFRRLHQEKFDDPEKCKLDLEYDLRTCDWIAEKCKSDVYAQNLYAALCNNEFKKNELWPLLKDQRWSCTWRYAGGIIADIRQEGDYIDWHCSGIRDNYDCGYVAESVVTDEIREDLNRLGWLIVDESGDQI